jgi:hypothetical protein
MADPEKSGATGSDGTGAAAPGLDTSAARAATAPEAPTGPVASPTAVAGHGLPETRPSIWGGHRSRQAAHAHGEPLERGPATPAAMAEAVRLAREAARHEWLHRIPDDPNERQRIADDLRP